MGLRLRFLADSAAYVAELRAGRLDWYGGDDAAALLASDARLRQRMRLLEYRSLRLGHHMVVWNLRRKPYDDVRVRQALSMLFDRRACVEHVFGGSACAAAAWFRPGEPEYPTDLEPMPFDPAAARDLLRASGVGGETAPFPVTVYVGNALASQRRMLEMALPAFVAAGLRLAIERRDPSEVLQRLENRDFDGVLLVWNHEPWIDPFGNFHSSQADAPGINYSGLNDPAVDALLVEARAQPDPRLRASRYAELARLLHRLQPVSLLVHPRHTVLVDKRFHGAEPGALGLVVDRHRVER
jgi:dipeptide transport system substrate-binding protein